MITGDDTSDSSGEGEVRSTTVDAGPKSGTSCQQAVEDPPIAKSIDATKTAVPNSSSGAGDQDKGRRAQNVDFDSVLINCTACGLQLNHKANGTFFPHPVLNVLICKKCFKFFTAGNFEKDENGIDEFCRWCAEGGKLICCDDCTNTFCESCIRRNFGRRELNNVKHKDVWKCYVCDPGQLEKKVHLCLEVLDFQKRSSATASFRGRKPVRSFIGIPPSAPNNPIDCCVTRMLQYAQIMQEALLTMKRKNLGAKSLQRRATIVAKIKKCLCITKGKLDELIDAVNEELAKLPAVDVGHEPVQNGGVSLSEEVDDSTVVSVKKPEISEEVTGRPNDDDPALIPNLDISMASDRSTIREDSEGDAEMQYSAKGPERTKDCFVMPSNDVEKNLPSPPPNVALDSVEENAPFVSSIHDGVTMETEASSCDRPSSRPSSDEELIESPHKNDVSEESVAVPVSLKDVTENELADESPAKGTTVEAITKDGEVSNNFDASANAVTVLSCKEDDGLSSGDVIQDEVDQTIDLSDANLETFHLDCGAETDTCEKDVIEKIADDKVSDGLKDKTLKLKVKKHSDEEIDAGPSEDEDELAKASLLKMLADESYSDSNGKGTDEEKSIAVQVAAKTVRRRNSEGKDAKGKEKSISVKDHASVPVDRLKSTTKISQSEVPVDAEGKKASEVDDSGSPRTKCRRKTTPKKEMEKGKNSSSLLQSKGGNGRLRPKLQLESSGESSFSSSDMDSEADGAIDVDDNKRMSLSPSDNLLDNLADDSKLYKAEPKVVVRRLDMDAIEDIKASHAGSSIKSDKEDSHDGSDSDDKDLRRILSTSSLKRKKKLETTPTTPKTRKGSAHRKAAIGKKSSLKLFSSDDENADSSDDSDLDAERNIRREIPEASSPLPSKDSLKIKTQDELAKESLMAMLDDPSDDISESEDEAPKKVAKKLADESEDGSSESEKKLKSLKTAKEDTDSDDDFIPMRKKTRAHCSILNARLSDSDSKTSKTSSKKRKRRPKNTSNESESSLATSSASDSSRSTKKKKNKKKVVKRRRIKMMADSSEQTGSDCEETGERISGSQGDTPSGKGRKNIRKLIKDKRLKEGTRQAAREEDDRRKRVAQLQKLYNVVVEEDPMGNHGAVVTKKLVLASHPDTKEPELEVHADLIRKLKPHQVEGVKFMWESTGETMDRLKNEPGSGCILAHCMGLGKTLQVITYVHTLLKNNNSGVKSCLVVCPLNTVLNWASEFKYWLTDTIDDDDSDDDIEVMELTAVKNNFNRAYALKNWLEDGGVMIVSYNMYRNLANENLKRCPKSQRKMFQEALVDPGPDIVICDEGHILKNAKSALSKAMDRIRSARRIILTGTPLQNNLAEYHCMVSFVKPNLLGTMNEFQNRFMNPISNGQCADSTASDVKLMKRRAHILHNLLDGCVQRMDYNVLVPFLPPKQEYVISIKLTELQVKLYRYYLDNLARQSGKNCLFLDCQMLSRVWTHPWVLRLGHIREQNKAGNETDNSFIDNDSPSDTSVDEDVVIFSSGEDKKNRPGTSKGRKSSIDSGDEEVINNWTTRKREGKEDAAEEELKLECIRKDDEWWSSYLSDEDEFKLELSGKLVVLFDILKECEAIGDKVLVFSQSLLSLDLLEAMLQRHSRDPSGGDKENDNRAKWVPDVDYFRMDGSTAADVRSRYTRIFNDRENFRARLFLISTKAGCLGINLVSANRVIIFDASWNPTHDVQSIFRVYRFGQEKPVYIYRFLAQGTMEEKIYDRQVTKQSLAIRVLDEQQVDRHFTLADLQELYSFDPDSVSKRPTPMLPKDRLLAELLLRHKELIVNYHEHDSLLVNVQEEELSEEDRKAAWVEYEAERKGLMNGVGIGGFAGANFRFDVTRILEDIQTKYPGLPLDELRAKFTTTIKMLTEAKEKEMMLQRQQQQQQFQQQQFQQQQLHHQQQQFQQQQMRMQSQLMNYRNLIGAGQNNALPLGSSNINHHLANAIAARNAFVGRDGDGDVMANDPPSMFRNLVSSAMNAQLDPADGNAVVPGKQTYVEVD